MRVRVKICGITRSADAEAAVTEGADALGFVLWNGSPRRVAVAEVLRMGLDLPPYVARVGVFVDELRPVLVAAVRNGRLTAAQLHGDEDPAYCGSLDFDWYRAFKAGGESDAGILAGEIGRFGQRPFMLDTRAGTAPGGTGKRFDWGLAERIMARLETGGGRLRLILAGGLTADNVGEAIRRLGPLGLWAVDVSSGVESSPGVKDATRIEDFMQAVRGAE